MATLTTQQRNNLPSSSFAVPSTRRFPINDKPHAIAAKRLLGRATDLSGSEKANIIKMANKKLMGK